MAVTLKGNNGTYEGTSEDNKPLDVPVNTEFNELDTGKTYYFDGETWNEEPPCEGSGFTPTESQLTAMNSGIDSTKVAQIATNETNILLKANTSDVNTATTNLQNQINQIEISASAEAVVAPEVAAARVDEDGVSYTTLKSRLDTTDAQRKNDISKIDTKVDYIADNLALKQGNLLDKSTITSGKIVKNDGTIADKESYGYSDYIPVSAGVHYIISQGLSAAGAIYNSNKEYVDRAYTVSSATSNYEFTASITGYVRLNFNLSLLDNSFLTLTSSDISDLAPYGKLSNPDLVIKKSQIIGSGDLSDMNLVIFGDSRTWYDGHEYGDKTKSECQGNVCVGYQQTIAALTGATITSQGVSGDTSAQLCDRIREFNFTDFDAVLLEGNVNDFVKSSSVTIGELQPIGSTFDTTTAYGAWQSAVEYLMTSYPNLRIYVDTPAVCWLGDNDTILPYSIARIKKDVAELYSLPCKDVYNELGITTINRDNFYCDDVELTNNWHLHFNDLGNAKLGEVLAKFILSN